MQDSLIASLMPRFSFSAETFFAGEFCGTNNFSAGKSAGQIHCISRGPVTMEHDDGASIAVTAPTLIFYPRPFSHRLVVAPGAQAELLCANVVFNEVDRNPFVLALPACLAIPLADLDGIAEVIRLLFGAASRDALDQRFIMDRLCDILVFKLIRHAVISGNLKAGVLAGFSDSGIAQALAAIHKDPARNWRVESLAEQASMSRSKFAKRFHDLVGLPPASYVADWRLSLAQNLLKQNHSVKAVAAAVGYGTQQSFTRAFIDKTGQPPTQWLSRQRAKN